MSRRITPFLAVILGFAWIPPAAHCIPPTEARRRASQFAVPNELRPRVNFWIDIFTKYSRNQVVVHRRDYRQIVFKVVDFRADAAILTPVLLERHKKAVLRRHVDEIRDAMSRLAEGAPPSTPLESLIVREMALIPGGPE